MIMNLAKRTDIVNRLTTAVGEKTLFFINMSFCISAPYLLSSKRLLIIF